MTRLRRALRWWSRNVDYQPIPRRHFAALSGAGLLVFNESEGCYALNADGRRALKKEEGL